MTFWPSQSRRQWPRKRKIPPLPWWSCRDVDFGYEAGQNVLHHLNMEIREGELATLSGRTGAGKSTVFKLVLGLYAPRRAPSGSRAWTPGPSPARSGGTVRLCGAAVPSGPRAPSGTRSPCMMTPSRRGRSAGRGAGGTGGGHRAPCRRAMTPPAPRTFSLRDSGSCCPSPGRWPADPKLLLLDEITANLDAETERAVLRALKRAAPTR